MSKEIDELVKVCELYTSFGAKKHDNFDDYLDTLILDDELVEFVKRNRENNQAKWLEAYSFYTEMRERCFNLLSETAKTTTDVKTVEYIYNKVVEYGYYDMDTVVYHLVVNDNVSLDMLNDLVLFNNFNDSLREITVKRIVELDINLADFPDEWVEEMFDVKMVGK